MASGFESGALLGHAYELDDGVWVRLRLARTSDLHAIRELLERDDPSYRELSAARLAHFDPRREWVLCATGLIDGHETLLGVGAIELGDAAAEPHLLLVADRAGEDVRRLLARALTGAAKVFERSRAA